MRLVVVVAAGGVIAVASSSFSINLSFIGILNAYRYVQCICVCKSVCTNRFDSG